MDSYILCGMQFGDEGKGSFIDYLAFNHNIDAVIKYNGGSQASHTVITPNGTLHKFSQLGSGMFLEKCHTYLTENMVINLDNLMVELDVFSKKTGIPISKLLERIHIHENCFVVTPYHKLINKLRELSKGEKRRGSVGTGVSEVKYLLYEEELGLQVKDIFNLTSNTPITNKLEALHHYANTFYHQNEDLIWSNTPDFMKDSLEKNIAFLLNSKVCLGLAMNYVMNLKKATDEVNLSKCIYSTYESSFRKECGTVIFEGSQGLLIDSTYGIKPNTTYLDTTINYALDISSYKDKIHKIGIAKAFTSRHGCGIFPTESLEVSSKISDENQESSFWNGSIRFGWFDAILLRYAQSINHVDELYLSSLDKLDSFEKLKICNEYLYNGIVDDKFKKIFEFVTVENGNVIITDIKENDDALSLYLEKCIPKYISINGWHSDISNISDKKMLPQNCLEYISTLEKLIHIPITVISVGSTRENKIQIAT